MARKVVLAGSEQLSMVEADAIALHCKNQNADVQRHELNSEINWDKCTADLETASHLFMVLGDDSDAEVVRKIMTSTAGTELRVGGIWKDARAVQLFNWLIEKRRFHFVVAFSPIDHSRVRYGCSSSLMIEPGGLCRLASKVVKAFIGGHTAAQAAA